MKRIIVSNSDSSINKSQINKQLDEYAFKGYRILCFATKIINPEDYNNWAKDFQEASNSISQRNLKIAKLADIIEQDLHLLGATAIEDKLQKVF